MAVTITNRATQLLIVQLNDGEAVYLAPGETSRPLEETQVGGNEKVAKLTRANLVSLGPQKDSAREPGETTEAGAGSEGPRRKPRS
jgi:hypothetical protein